MNRALFRTLRRDRDLKSAMLAVCVLFLMTGLLGAFASGATALPTEDVAVIHCYAEATDESGAVDEGVSCCTLGCPMVSAALPVPVGAGLIDRGFVQQTTEPASEIAVTPPTRRVALDTARGPPLPI